MKGKLLWRSRGPKWTCGENNQAESEKGGKRLAGHMVGRVEKEKEEWNGFKRTKEGE